ncbi:MAG TPA: PAS domain S-box protein [Gemmataceae bacterium]|jgi:PAS domain S-box-containing protein|nr:PAS domain S-box protein [Gemmataceae bacterium]
MQPTTGLPPAAGRDEDDLRYRAGLLQTITDNATVAMFVEDGRGRCTFMNAAAEAMTGFTFAEVEGKVLHELIHHTHPDGTPFPMSECRIGESVLNLRPLRGHEDVFVRKDGTFFPVHCNASPITAGGALVGVYLEVRDVTAERRAGAALSESEARFRQLADLMPQLAWMARPDGHIYWYNRRWYEYTGTTLEQMQGWGWQSVHDPEQLPQVLERWQESIATGLPFDMAFPLRGADGRPRTFLTRVMPLRGEDGRILHWFGTNTDISEIKEKEAALEEADRRKNEFLAMLGHELRNPLVPVRNGLAILKMPAAPADAVRQVREMMEHQVLHMVRLVDDLLDVSRIMQGKIELRREPVELATVVQRALETARPALDAGGHELTVTLPGRPVLLDGDTVRLAQVVGNLLGNAAKYTEPGGRVWLSAERDGPGAVVVRVKDTGVGIGADLLPRVFDLFVQADRSLARSEGGLGVGLTLVKKLVEMHGGSVSAYSEGPGRGSEFVVRLPAVPEAPAAAGGPAPGGPATAGTSRRVLVVEDSVDAAESTAMLLRLLGHAVETVYNGPSVLGAVRRFRPELVLLDIGLPGMSGYEVARQLRAEPGLGGLVVAAMTGYGQDDDRRRSHEAGCDAHLTKPLAPADLVAFVADPRAASAR